MAGPEPVVDVAAVVDREVLAVRRLDDVVLVRGEQQQGDGEDDADYLADKTAELRVFPDEAGKMNRSVVDAGGGLLVISQFTLYGDCRRGRRPWPTSRPSTRPPPA